MLVYVSGPYSGPDRWDNIERASNVAADLWERGFAVICPHANTANFEDRCNATYEQFLAGDLVIIGRCDAVVMMPAWETSRGATVERDFALSQEIPVYVWPDLPAPSQEIPSRRLRIQQEATLKHPTEIRCPEQVGAFAAILEQMYQVHLDKNFDYSPANILATGEIGLVTRLWDKIARLMNLEGFRFDVVNAHFDAPKQPKHESIDDTLVDSAVYSIIGLLLRQGKWGK